MRKWKGRKGKEKAKKGKERKGKSEERERHMIIGAPPLPFY